MGVYNPKTDASYKKRWKNENIKEYKEAVFDRISELLINRFPEISEETNQEIEDFQKTWKNGKVIAGRNSEDVMVVYQSDTEANAGDKRIIDLMMDWLEFTHPKYIKLKFEKVVNSDGVSRKELVFSAPGKNDLQINSIIGARDLKGVRLKDNVYFISFYMGSRNFPPV